MDKVMKGDLNNLKYRATVVSTPLFMEPSSSHRAPSSRDINHTLRQSVSGVMSGFPEVASASARPPHPRTHASSPAPSSRTLATTKASSPVSPLPKKVKVEPGVFPKLSAMSGVTVKIDSSSDEEAPNLTQDLEQLMEETGDQEDETCAGDLDFHEKANQAAEEYAHFMQDAEHAPEQGPVLDEKDQEEEDGMDIAEEAE